MSKRLLVQEANAPWQANDRPRRKSNFEGRRDAGEVSAAELGSPALGEVIRGRIRKRIGDRVHDLDVSVDEAAVVLQGRCATFYTKQLAQHAALGVLNDEQLDNQIVVTSG